MLLPESFLYSEVFAVMSTVVAINTIIFVALAVAKMLPRIYLSDLYTSRNRRTETRSIHPDDPV
ncbi:hypothetical protein FVA74_05310 [Salinibacterium sp. dk2585]|nr:hypothetical protein FVA74_05310 [Salinibacterium sp. dk2585]TXK53114.1 hypothetical protein FVP63_11430 [Salinibacterium sp. dk5596]